MNRIVQSLWIGDRLTSMEQLSIRSFLANDHIYHLYCYGDVEGIPEGAVVKDGGEILPESRIFTYREGFAAGSPTAFSNFFRYKLLLERGGWWVDTDIVCLRTFDLPDDRLWATEQWEPPERLIVSTSVIKAPPGDALMAWAWHECQKVDTANAMFGQLGPRLLQAGVDELGLHAFMRPHTFFSPIPFFDWRKMLDPSQVWVMGKEVYGVHLWNQMWASGNVDRDEQYPDGCFYEQLKRRFPESWAARSKDGIRIKV